MEKKLTFKYDEDDILEIVTEYMAQEHGFGTFRSKSIILGTPGKDLRLVAIISELEDESIREVNLEAIDKNIEYNGSHSHAISLDVEEFKKIDFKNIKEV